MSKLTRDDGQLLIHMISTWLTYTHLDEMDSDHIANAADLLHRAGVSSGEAEVFEICLPLHYDSRDASNARATRSTGSRLRDLPSFAASFQKMMAADACRCSI